MVPLYQGLEQFSKLRRVSAREGRVGAATDLHRESRNVYCVERNGQGSKLEEDTAKGPYVGFEGVRLALENFWRQVVRSARDGLGKLVLGLQYAANSKVPDKCLVPLT